MYSYTVRYYDLRNWSSGVSRGGGETERNAPTPEFRKISGKFRKQPRLIQQWASIAWANSNFRCYFYKFYLNFIKLSKFLKFSKFSINFSKFVKSFINFFSKHSTFLIYLNVIKIYFKLLLNIIFVLNFVKFFKIY